MWKTLLPGLLLHSGLALAQPGPIAEELATTGKTAAVVPDAGMSAFTSGILALKNERPREALDLFTRELAARPQNGKAWYYRAVCHASIDDHSAALNDLDRALELLPNDANVLLRRSEARLALGEPQRAIADLNTVLSRHTEGPIAVHAMMSLGEAYMRLGDHRSAVTVYDRNVAAAPNDARSWFNRGIAHAHNDAHQEAYADFSRAIALDGWMFRAYSARAIELVHLDRKTEACVDLMRAKELGDQAVDDLLAIYCE
jgi:tetratricopeptide (TPR) repeat protein